MTFLSPPFVDLSNRIKRANLAVKTTLNRHKKSLAAKLETTLKPSKPPTTYPQTSQNHPTMSRKSVFYDTKILSDNAKHVLSLGPFYAIKLKFINEYQSQVGIEGK